MIKITDYLQQRLKTERTYILSYSYLEDFTRFRDQPKQMAHFKGSDIQKSFEPTPYFKTIKHLEAAKTRLRQTVEVSGRISMAKPLLDDHDPKIIRLVKRANSGCPNSRFNLYSRFARCIALHLDEIAAHDYELRRDGFFEKTSTFSVIEYDPSKVPVQSHK